MLTLDEIKRKIATLKIPIYNSQIHLELLGETIALGKSVACYCSKAFINKTTFYSWVKLYPEFKYAFEVALAMGETEWEEMIFTSGVDLKGWLTIYSKRYNYGKQRVNLQPEVTSQEYIRVIWEALSHGDISVDETVKLTQLVAMQSNINGIEKDNKQLTQEEKDKVLDALNKIIPVLEETNK